MSDEQKEKLLIKAVSLCDRAIVLLDQCYIAHCKAVGIKP